jgi:hypothetical protein
MELSEQEKLPVWAIFAGEFHRYLVKIWGVSGVAGGENEISIMQSPHFCKFPTI